MGVCALVVWFGCAFADCPMCAAGGSAAAAGGDDENASDCGGWGTVNVHVPPSFHVCRSVLCSERHVGMPRFYPTELPKAPELDLDLDSRITMTEFRPTFLKLPESALGLVTHRLDGTGTGPTRGPWHSPRRRQRAVGRQADERGGRDHCATGGGWASCGGTVSVTTVCAHIYSRSRSNHGQ